MKANIRLKEAREACGLSQLEVAKALGLVSSTVFRWEKTDRLPKEADLKALARIYQVSLKWILTGEGEGPTRDLDRKLQAKQVLFEMNGVNPTVTLKGENWQLLKANRSRKRAVTREGLMASKEARLLTEISSRIKPILAVQNRLPSLPGLSRDVVMAMRLGLVVPTPEVLLLLAERTNVLPQWYLLGEAAPILTKELVTTSTEGGADSAEGTNRKQGASDPRSIRRGSGSE